MLQCNVEQHAITSTDTGAFFKSPFTCINCTGLCINIMHVLSRSLCNDEHK